MSNWRVCRETTTRSATSWHTLHIPSHTEQHPPGQLPDDRRPDVDATRVHQAEQVLTVATRASRVSTVKHNAACNSGPAHIVSGQVLICFCASLVSPFVPLPHHPLFVFLHPFSFALSSSLSSLLFSSPSTVFFSLLFLSFPPLLSLTAGVMQSRRIDAHLFEFAFACFAPSFTSLF